MMKKLRTSTRQRDRTTGGSDKLTLFLSLLCRSIQSRLFSRSESRPLLKSRAAPSLRWSFIFKASSSGPHIMPSSPSLSFSFCWKSPFAQTRAHNLRKKTEKVLFCNAFHSANTPISFAPALRRKHFAAVVPRWFQPPLSGDAVSRALPPLAASGSGSSLPAPPPPPSSARRRRSRCKSYLLRL